MTFATGTWTPESVELAARAIGAQLFPSDWNDLAPHERSQCRRTAGTALGAAICAVQKNDIERSRQGLPLRPGFVTVVRG